jgi:XTP/dITP diphosphohydrolase
MRDKTGHRKLTGERLVVASHNPGKLREIAKLLAPLRIETISAAALGLAEPEETGDTFEANAELKALAAAGASGLPAIADDSGLCVDALDGAPGIHSARWAGPTKDFRAAMARVERELADVPPAERTAHFVCALCLAWPDGHAETFIGRIDGRLVFPPRGDKGFGYDPIFLAAGEHQAFGEMDPAKKHAMSHRARAFAQLITACFDAK